MAFDSTIRLKQLNNPELSGYILGVIGSFFPGATGNYTGLFYPYTGNPAGFIGTGVTGQFASTAATTLAINSANTQTLSYVALNYLPNTTPISSGTSGTFIQITGSNSLTGANFSGIGGTIIEISGNYVLISGAGGSGSVNTGVLTGAFYPLNSNPSNYVLASNTGILASSSNLQLTGAALQSEIGSLNTFTGNSTGLYYPLNNNISGFALTGKNNTFTASNTFNSTSVFNQTSLFNQATSFSSQVIFQTGSILYDNTATEILDPTNRFLFDEMGTQSVDFNNRILSGTWHGQSGLFSSGLFVSGNSVTTGGPYLSLNQTGQFVTTGQTGTLTGTLTGIFLSTIPYTLNYNSLDNPTFLGFQMGQMSSFNNVNKYAWNSVLNKLKNNQPINLMFGVGGLSQYQNPSFLMQPIWDAQNVFGLKGFLNCGSQFPWIYNPTSGPVYADNSKNTVLIPNNVITGAGGIIDYYPYGYDASNLGYNRGSYPLYTNLYNLYYVADSGAGGFSIFTGLQPQPYIGTLGPWTFLTGINATSGVYTPMKFTFSGNSPVPIQIRISGTGSFSGNGLRILTLDSINTASGLVNFGSFNGSSVSPYQVWPLSGNQLNILNTLFSGWNPDVFLLNYAFQPNYDGGNADAQTQIGFGNYLQSILPNCCVIHCGNYPNPSSNQILANQVLEYFSAVSTGKCAYFDGISPFIDFPTWSGRGFGVGDGTHYNLSGGNAYSNFLANWFNLSEMPNAVNGLSQNVTKITGNFTVTANTPVYLISGSMPITGTFPDAFNASGYEFTIKDWKGVSATNNIVLTGIKGQTFDGSPNFILNINYSSVGCISDGANWTIV